MMPYSDDMIISFEQPDGVRMDYTGGTVVLYNGYPLPDELSEPIRSNINGRYSGLCSGHRSALVRFGKKWFKCKGIRPTPLQFLNSKQPYGSLTLESAETELEANGILDRKFREFGFSNGPLAPAGRIDYDVPFENGKCHAAILECFGDSRILSVFEAIEESNKSYNTEVLENLYSEICSWMGFTQMLLQEENMLFPKGNNDTQNYVFFNVDGGFGIGVVDHDSTKRCDGSNELKESLDHTKEQLIFTLMEMSDLLGMGTESLEKYRSLENKLKTVFYDSFDGKITPEAISKKHILQFFV